MNPRTDRRKSGVAIVEAAILFPLLLVLMFGLIEYSWAFLKVQQLSGAARQGARIGITQPAVNGDVSTAIDTLMAKAGLASSGYSVTITPADVSTALPGTSLTVEVTLTYANVALTGFPLPLPTTLSGNITMIKEGPVAP